MVSQLFKSIKTTMLNAGVNFSTDTFKVALLGAGYQYNAANTTWADVSAQEVSGQGYVAGGQALAGQAVANGVFTANSVVWQNSTLSANYAVIYDVTEGNKLVALIDLGDAKSSSNSDFTITWSPSGIVRL